MFRKILIANRGEIAVRVARTARRLGISTVAVYSDADAASPHARMCDEAVRIGAAPAADSYLRAERIIDAARRTGAQAVHPGYGFLSENAEFADAVEAAGLIFIGPTAQSIRAIGSKSAAKDLMAAAGVPTTPGYQGTDQSVETFRRECARIGYPVLLKASAGGGGKGMRIVECDDDLENALSSARREAMSAFSDDRVLVEKYIPRARHLEVQIVGDGRGEVVHLFERDCSVQRRHQKIIEEAPAPRLPTALRERLHHIGVEAGKAIAYRGAGTVECLYDGADGIFFMEMNTRLQVEHPVTEMITGIDLVEWQFRIAAGEPLPRSQAEIQEFGHAFEARLYAENPDADFAPSTGTLTRLSLPTEIARIDSGVEEGQSITPYYDPMIAKIIVHDQSRALALARLADALARTRVAGIETNARFLHALASDSDFAAGDVSTRYIDDHRSALMSRPPVDERALAAALLNLDALSRNHSQDPWDSLNGFRLNADPCRVVWLERDGSAALFRVYRRDDVFEAEIEPCADAAARREGRTGGEPTRFSFQGSREKGSWRIRIGDDVTEADVVEHGQGLRVFIGADVWDLRRCDPLSGAGAQLSAGGSLAAPMPGIVTLLKARPGETVAAGATLVIMEAMKMEHSIKAPHAGIIKAFRFKPGDQVKDGDLLVDFEEIM